MFYWKKVNNKFARIDLSARALYNMGNANKSQLKRKIMNNNSSLYCYLYEILRLLIGRKPVIHFQINSY